MTYTASQIAEILGLQSANYADTGIDVLLTDSRALTYPETSLFFALKTSTNDGHRFIPELIDRGVRNFVVETLPADAPEGVNSFVVPDVEQALRKLSAAHRKKFSIPVVGITGSRGKTVVKEWLNKMLSPDFRIARSPRSFNSHIGVPLAVWELDADTQLGIFEAGISRTGEMDALQEIIAPTVGILTNIGEAHDDGFCDRHEKCVEKLKLFKDSDLLVYRADDPVVRNAVEDADIKARKIGWSTGNVDGAIPVTAEELPDGMRLKLVYDGVPVEAVIPFKDDASVEDAVHAIVTMLCMGTKPELIAARARKLCKVDTRLDVIEGVRGCMIINDSFTNDFDSLAVALDFMKRRVTPDRTLTVILNDFDAEAGDNAKVYRKMVALLKCKGVKRLICVGPQLKRYAEGFENATGFDDVAGFLGKMSQQDFNDELILVKGDSASGFHFITEMLEARQHETVLEVNLDAIVHNFNEYKSRLKPATGIVAMVKAFGYGAGSYELAKTLQSQGAAYLAVAVADEGADLRRAGITMPIMVLNPRVDSYPMMFDNKLEPEIFSFDLLDQFIREARRQGVKNYPIHIKLDTGMHRLGYLAAADAPAMDDYTMEQFAMFKKCSDMLQAAFPHHILRHILNSTGITRFPQYQYDMVRLGICLYGISTMNDHSQDFLQPVSSLKTAVISIKDWCAGTTIGYNRRGVLSGDSRIATIPIGYADGMNRHFGNGAASVYINGRRCPTVGNICMDACMIDVTDVKCEVGDTVEIFGPNIPAAELASILDTIPYEVLTSVSARVKRVYYRE